MLGNEIIKKSSILSINQLIFKKYRLLNLISEGIFGQVYIAINISTNKYYAVKAERKDSNFQLLEHEAYNLYSIKNLGIPELITFGRINNYNVLIEELLGKSLFEIFKEHNNSFSMQDICLISIQLIERLEWIHSKTFIHRDLKPQNFLMGRENKNNIIYLTEFGLCLKYCSSKTGKHILPGFRGTFTGTLKYSSANAQRGNQQSRRDDIESLGYNIIFFMKGELPWEHLNLKYNEKELYLKTYAMKKYMPVERLCKGLPPEMEEYFKYVRNLQFQEKPNYNYLKNLFKTILKKNGFENYEDLNLSWANIANNVKVKKKRTLSPKARLYLKIKNQIQLNKEINSEKTYTQINNIQENNNKTQNKYINHYNPSSSFSQVNNSNNLNKMQNIININNNKIKSDNLTSLTEREMKEKKEQIKKPKTINKEKDIKIIDKYQTTRNEYNKKYFQTSISNCENENEDKIFKYHKISTDNINKKQLNHNNIELNEINKNKNNNNNKINNLQMKKINPKINNYNYNYNNSYLTNNTINNKITSNQLIDKSKNNFKKSITLKNNIKLNINNINNNLSNIEQNKIYNTNINEYYPKTVLKKANLKQYPDVNKGGKNNILINQNNKYQNFNYINNNKEKNNIHNKINNIITTQYNY